MVGTHCHYSSTQKRQAFLPCMVEILLLNLRKNKSDSHITFFTFLQPLKLSRRTHGWTLHLILMCFLSSTPLQAINFRTPRKEGNLHYSWTMQLLVSWSPILFAVQIIRVIFQSQNPQRLPIMCLSIFSKL